MDVSLLAGRIAQVRAEVFARLGDAPEPASGAGRAAVQLPTERFTSIREVASLIDHTLLRPEATPDQIIRLCEEAAASGFASVCVNPVWVSLCASVLSGAPVTVDTVVGFPLGASLTDVKRYETERAAKAGAKEIDMVVQIGALRAGDLERVYLDILSVAGAAHEGAARVKVILETAFLSDDEKIRGCVLARLGGADFVKTSTGFAPAGATEADVFLMRQVVGDELGVKAAGGIRSFSGLQSMVAAGATRIGTSAGRKILEEARSALETGSLQSSQ